MAKEKLFVLRKQIIFNRIKNEKKKNEKKCNIIFLKSHHNVLGSIDVHTNDIKRLIVGR